MKILLIILYCISLHAIDEQKYKIECDNGNLKSCNELGNFYANESGKNPELLLKKACNGGFGESCYHLAYYYRGFGQSNIPIYDEYLKKACNGEFALACYELGQNSEPLSIKKNKDWSLSLDYYRRGCDYGDQDSCTSYFDICKKNDIMIHYSRSRNIRYNKTHKIQLKTNNKTKHKVVHSSNCENNNGNLVWIESSNKWVCQKKNLESEKNVINEDKNNKASQLEKACDNNNFKECCILGFMYAQGDGVNRDLLKTKKLFNKACDGGFGTGCFILGQMYARGEGVKPDLSKTKELYGKACDNGYPEGCIDYNFFNQKGY